MSDNIQPNEDPIIADGTPVTKNLVSSLSDLQLTLQNTNTQSTMSKPLRELALQQELDQLRKINETISNISESLDVTDVSLNRMINHTEQSNELLNLWIKILSQNHHTYKLLNDQENWKGKSDFENNHELKLSHLQDLEDKISAMKEQRLKEQDLKKLKDEERQKSLKKDKRIYKNRS